MRRVVFVGQEYGKLRVLAKVGVNRFNNIIWRCECITCHRITTSSTGDLRRFRAGCQVCSQRTRSHKNEQPQNSRPASPGADSATPAAQSDTGPIPEDGREASSRPSVESGLEDKPEGD